MYQKKNLKTYIRVGAAQHEMKYGLASFLYLVLFLSHYLLYMKF